MGRPPAIHPDKRGNKGRNGPVGILEDGDLQLRFQGGSSMKPRSASSEEQGIAGDIASDRAGNLYYAWPGLNSRTIRVRKSTDGGVSFAASVIVASMNTSFSFPIPDVEQRQVVQSEPVQVSIKGPGSSGRWRAGVSRSTHVRRDRETAGFVSLLLSRFSAQIWHDRKRSADPVVNGR